MTPTKTIIPIEYVKQSKALQGVATKEYYDCNGELTDCCNGPSFKSRNGSPGLHLASSDIRPNLPAPSIADVIDSAESLFGKNKVVNVVARTIQNRIFVMCQQNKSIDEISEYIIDNIKE